MFCKPPVNSFRATHFPHPQRQQPLFVIALAIATAVVAWQPGLTHAQDDKRGNGARGFPPSQQVAPVTNRPFRQSQEDQNQREREFLPRDRPYFDPGRQRDNDGDRMRDIQRNRDAERYRADAERQRDARRAEDRHREEVDRQRQWHNDQNNRFQSGYRPDGSRPPGVPPARYYYRDDDNRWLRNYYRDDVLRIDRNRRTYIGVGVQLSSGYQSYMRPFPSEFYGRVQAPPPGYAIGYYEGYSVVYDPDTGVILSFIDLVD